MEVINDSQFSSSVATLFLEKWTDAIESRNVDKVMKLYHPDAVLWGEFSDFLRFTPEEIADYFYHFLALDSLGVEIKSSCIQNYGDITQVSGIYEFSYLKTKGVGVLESRYSFTFRHVKNGWQIINHHSSIIPDEVY